jgi:signal transduction histidine kinase
VTRDLTDRKRHEESLLAVLERERAVADRLRTMDKTKDEILSVVAHDLRGPLTVLDGLLEMLDQSWDNLSSDEKRDALRRMTRSTGRLRRLVGDVMDVTRIDTGDLRYEFAAFDADALARGVVSDIAIEHALRVQVEPSAAGAATAWGDEQRAWQVLTNLLSNALKFSPPDSPVELRVDTSTGEVRFDVVDHGPGVAAEDHDRIFEKFSRAAAATAPVSGEGTGLGLYIARSLAHGQGGRIHVESAIGRGSTFTFVLPEAGGDIRPIVSQETQEADVARQGLRPVDDPPASEPHSSTRDRSDRHVARSGAGVAAARRSADKH